MYQLKHSQCPGGGVLPYMGYIGMCGTKGYCFLAIFVPNRVSILTILVSIRYGLFTLVLNWICFIDESTSVHHHQVIRPFPNVYNSRVHAVTACID